MRGGEVEILPVGAERKLFVLLHNDELKLLAGILSSVDETPHGERSDFK